MPEAPSPPPHTHIGGRNTFLICPVFLTNPLEQETHVDSILLRDIR